MNFNYLELASQLDIRGRQAGNQLYARCPLHQERTPSFSLHIYAGVWSCHKGCGPESGRDFATLVRLIKGCTSFEAHQWMVGHGREQDPAETLRSISELLRDTAPENLEFQMAEQAQAQRDYYDSLDAKFMAIGFLGRGFTWQTISQWGIRYDLTREAVVIPVYDYAQEFRGTVSRLMNPRQGQGKYFNSPGLAKQEILFGLSPQRHADGIILVEGPLDAIWLQQHGYPGAALFGSSISAAQIMVMRKTRIAEAVVMTDNPLIDEAGAKAQGQIRQRLLQSGWLLNQITTVKYPPPDGAKPQGYKDANDCTPEQLSDMLLARTTYI